MKKILLVDDNSVSLSLAKSMLSDLYNVSAVLSGEEAIKFLEKKDCDLLLIDINMPNMSGFETLKAIKENPLTADLPFMFLTSDSDPETERKCFEMGAYDFIVKPFQKATLRARVGRTLDLLSLQKDLEEQLLEKTKEIARISLKSMMMIANTVDKKDPMAGEHSSNVAWFAVEIAKKMGWSNEELYNLQNLALVHDIGNIGVADTIIRKSGPLSDSEFDELKKHTTFGKNILRDMTVIRKAAEIAETHHEHYDGTGYPNGLSGDDIPVEARIIAIADAFDSMTNDRSFRKKLDKKTMLAEFAKGRGTQFDPKMTDIAIELLKNDSFTRKENEADHDTDIASQSSQLLQKVLQEYTRGVKSEASKDSLTGAWNRNYTVDYLNDYLTDKRHCGCFFMIDIDGFKSVNDTYGHIAGDNMIIKLSDMLRSLIRSDDIVCRIGGDEFIVFFKGVATHEFAEAKAEEIIIALDNSEAFRSIDLSLSISIGIATAPHDGTDFATLYNKADKALYHVKENGKHSYHFFSDMTAAGPNTSKSTLIDLEYLRRFLVSDTGTSAGGYQVEYDSFKKIYHFLARAQKRTKQPVLMLLLTITDLNGDPLDSDLLSTALSHLKNAVATAIRSGDIATNYSSSQYIALLVDSSLSNGYLVAERIRKLFYDEISNTKVKLTYDLDRTPELK